MRKTLIAVSLSICFSSFAQEEDKGLSSYWFKVLPESESLLSLGIASSHELPKNIRALVWNIKKAELVDWKSEFLKYGKGKDLFVLQEAYETPTFQSTLLTFKGAQWDMGISFLYRRYGNQATGTMVGSYARPNDVFVKHSWDREPVIATPKAVTFAKYNVEDSTDELLVISVHAINFETAGAFKRQMDQVEAEIVRHKGPILLAGDFNTWNASRSTYLSNMVKRLELKENDYINGNQRMMFRGWYLDHVYTRGIQVKSSEVIGSAKGSDHRPFVIEMTIQ